MYTSGRHPLKKKKNSSDAGNALRWTSRWSPIVEKNGGKALPLDNPLEQCLLPLCSVPCKIFCSVSLGVGGHILRNAMTFDTKFQASLATVRRRLEEPIFGIFLSLRILWTVLFAQMFASVERYRYKAL
jgi:hypothetical protein